MAKLNKIEDRKAFNFFRSYWEVGKLLTDTDRLSFYDAILKRQFTKEETELTGMANFAYVSQKHNIDNQINGFESVGLRLNNVTPKIGASLVANDSANDGATDGASVQVQVQVQDKGQDKKEKKEKTKVFIPPTISDVISYFIENGYNEMSAKKAFNYYDCAEWVDSKGNKVKNWKQKMQSVWFKDENKINIPNKKQMCIMTSTYSSYGKEVEKPYEIYEMELRNYGSENVKLIKML